MKTESFFKLGLAALVSITLAACSSSGADAEAEEAARRAAEEEAARREAAAQQAAAAAARAEPELTAEEMREQEMLQMTVFYFDFDKSDLKPEAREALVYHANRLKANPNMTVRLEGHADERGTREYNLALGERRAQSVQRYLQVQGVSSNQMETVSYGEERPVASGTSESAYARNRRVELQF